MKNILLILLTLLVVSCSPEEKKLAIDSSDDRTWEVWENCSQKIGEHPCNFELLNHTGEKVELYDYYGKIIIIDLSTMWCGVCNTIATKGDELALRYGSENLVWLTILIEDYYGESPDQSMLSDWQSRFNIQSQVLGGSRDLIDHTAENGYPVTGWPTLVVIDRDMVLKHGISGWSENLITQWIEEML